MTAIYNEIEPCAAAWLTNLVAAGHIATGNVDTRSIRDARPDDVRGEGQRHFFAGIGVWSHALRLAGWPDELSVWTGSCPCQPFSAAGKGGGFDDERHLWPVWFELIRECRPAVVFGEQVASAAGLEWLDLVQADLEASGYAVGAADLGAASVGAPHIRQRLYFVAYANGERLEGVRVQLRERRSLAAVSEAGRRGAAGRLANADLAHAEHGEEPRGRELVQPAAQPTSGFWDDAEWIPCRDGKWRPVEPGTFPLVNGATGRVGKLRAYGNAIVAQAAAEFIGAFVDAMTHDEVRHGLDAIEDPGVAVGVG